MENFHWTIQEDMGRAFPDIGSSASLPRTEESRDLWHATIYQGASILQAIRVRAQIIKVDINKITHR